MTDDAVIEANVTACLDQIAAHARDDAGLRPVEFAARQLVRSIDRLKVFRRTFPGGHMLVDGEIEIARKWISVLQGYLDRME